MSAQEPQMPAWAHRTGYRRYAARRRRDEATATAGALVPVTDAERQAVDDLRHGLELIHCTPTQREINEAIERSRRHG